MSTIFTGRYLKNLARELIDDVPIVRKLFAAYDRTLEEIETEFQKAETETKQEIVRVIKERVPKIEQLPNFEYETSEFVKPLALPAPPISDNAPTAGE